MKKNILLLFSFVLITNVYSQNVLKGKVEDLKKLTERRLAVIILEEDPAYIERLTKRINKTKKEDKKVKFQKELIQHKEGIVAFNKLMKDLVPKYWHMNNVNDITYFSKRKAKELIKEGNDTYAVLDISLNEIYLTDLSDTTGNLIGFNYALVTYGGSENTRNNPSFRNLYSNVNYNFPKINAKNDDQKKLNEDLKKEKEGKQKVYSKENIITTFTISQLLINDILENNKKTTVQNYAIEQSKLYCDKLEGKKILIQSANISKKLFNEFEKYKDRVEMVSAERIAEAIINKEDVIIGFPSIQKYFKARGGIGPVTVTKVDTINHKTFFNPKTGKIVGFSKAGKPLNYRAFTRKEIDKFYSCSN